MRVVLRLLREASRTGMFYVIGGFARFVAGVQSRLSDIDVFYPASLPMVRRLRVLAVLRNLPLQVAFNPLVRTVIGRARSNPCVLLAVPGDSVEEHLANTHFSVGAVAYDPASGEVIDEYGGLRDYAAGRLVAVRDPEEMLLRDPAGSGATAAGRSSSGWG